ncbi:MAG: uracil-DNA glycosylase [Phycisphaerales bacterium]|nr:uracil-DNA glycosylase [Phycisphaerales bacterium]
MDVNIEAGWKLSLKEEFRKEYFEYLVKRLQLERAGGQIFYPPGNLIFNAFNQTPLSSVRIVILGQDPYHGPGQAMGLSFSVSKQVPIPPSLKNIFKELHNDVGVSLSKHGDLTNWAKQGVFLLNTVLTVRPQEANSHAHIGWEQFTDAVIKIISDECKAVVFLLWGKQAISKKVLINQQKHLVLCAAHPSPLSAYQGFLGCKHFSKANEWLIKKNQSPIDWYLPQ